MDTELNDYERVQNFNAITRFLHANRYRNLLELAGQLTPRSGERLKVLDIGSGPCKAYAVLREAVAIDYHAVEIDDGFVADATKRYGGRDDFRLTHGSITDHLDALDGIDLVIGLESFEHIPESQVVRVLEAVGQSDFQRLYITVPNEVGPAIAVKNVGSLLMGYERHREYSWGETFAASVYDLDRVGLHGTGHKGFDWRWLAQTIRHNCEILEIFTSPSKMVPRFISPSIGFVAKKRG
jgi:SAM-dependent methyltransferase